MQVSRNARVFLMLKRETLLAPALLWRLHPPLPPMAVGDSLTAGYPWDGFHHSRVATAARTFTGRTLQISAAKH